MRPEVRDSLRVSATWMCRICDSDADSAFKITICDLDALETNPALVDSRILTVRGQKVMLDADLAAVYGVATKAFNQAIKRNIERFPPDFRFQLTKAERDEVVTNCDHLPRLKFSPVRPWAFTEHGAVMAATVLKSPRAVEMSLFVVRAFVRLRDLAGNHAALAAKLDAFERKMAGHDADIEQMFATLRALIAPGRKARRQIGF